MRLYHRTTPQAACEIVRERSFRSRYPGGEVWTSNRRNGEAAGYGSGVVRLEIPVSELQLDDEFPSGERHYTIGVERIRPEYIIDRE